jgi:segregation and condensation protein B
MSREDGVLPFPIRPVEEGLEEAVEALLFAAGEPCTAVELAVALKAERAEVEAALKVLVARTERRGVQLKRVGGRWQFRTAPRFGRSIARLRGGKPRSLSRAAMEVLAIVAWRQPVTRAEVDGLRGVGCSGPVNRLLAQDLLRVSGRRDVPGRPEELSTSKRFLEVFSLESLADLPAPPAEDEEAG